MSQVIEEPVENPPEYHGKGITTATKFMHQYREASPVDGGRNGCAIRNKDGQIELFTIGTDRTVWNYYPDPKSATGYNKADTGLKGEAIAAGVDGDGLIWLFAVATPTLYYVSQSSKPAQRWSTPVEARWMQGATPSRTDAVFTRTIDGRLYVGVRGRGPGNSEWWSVWPDTSGNFWGFPGGVVWNQDFDRNYFAFSNAGDPPANLSFLCGVCKIFGGNESGIVCLRHPTFQGEHLPWVEKVFKIPSQPENPLSVDIATDKLGTDKLFCVFADGNVYRTVTDGDGKWAAWEKLSDNLNFRQVWATNDRKGDTHLLCLAENKRLYHLQPTDKYPIGYGTPADIGGGLPGRVQWATVARNNGGEIELYLALTGHGSPLIRMGLEQSVGRWQDTPIEIPPDSRSKPSERIEQFISYSTDLSVTDEVGAPLINAPVTVLASDRTTITTNGETTEIDQSSAAHLNLNAAGQLTITQETDGLGVPALWVHIAGLMPADQVLILEQYGDGHDDAGLPVDLKSVENRLANVTAKNLKNAKDADGIPLLKHQENADALATAFNQCMKLPDRERSLPGTLHPLLAQQGPRNGVHIGSTAEALERIRVTPRPDLPSWMLTFEDGRASYQTLTHEEAEALIAETTANSRSTADSDSRSWWSIIGDFLEAIVDGFVELGKMIVDGVRATFNFVVDGVKYVFNAVVNFVQDAFDMIEAILASAFASVERFFERTFEWLGFLFNWKDILRTRTALSYWALEYLTFLEGAAGGIQAFLDKGIATAKKDVDRAFAELINAVGAKSPGGYVKDNEPKRPEFAHSAANNILMNGLMNNVGSSATSSLAFAATHSTELDGIFVKLQELAQTAKNQPDFTAAMAYMSNLGGNPDEVFKQLLSALLRLVQGVIKGVLDGVQAIVDGILQLVASIVADLRKLLEAQWNIPFVSDFYRWLTKTDDNPDGDPLTLLDLFALIIAIPSTPLYKILKGKAPFPDQKSLDDFKASYNAKILLGMSGFGPKSQPAVTVTGVEGDIFDAASCIGNIVFMFTTVLLDVQAYTGTGAPTELTKFWSKFALGFKVFAKACSFPLLIRPAGQGCDAKAAAFWALYAYECFGLAIDSGFVLKSGKETMPENDDTLSGPILTTLYGAGHVILVGYAWPHLSTAGRYSKVFMLIPECTKLVRVVPHPAAKVVIGLIDGICITGSALAAAVAAFTLGVDETAAEILYPPSAMQLAN